MESWDLRRDERFAPTNATVADAITISFEERRSPQGAQAKRAIDVRSFGWLAGGSQGEKGESPVALFRGVNY